MLCHGHGVPWYNHRTFVLCARADIRDPRHTKLRPCDLPCDQPGVVVRPPISSHKCHRFLNHPVRRSTLSAPKKAGRTGSLLVLRRGGTPAGRPPKAKRQSAPDEVVAMAARQDRRRRKGATLYFFARPLLNTQIAHKCSSAAHNRPGRKLRRKRKPSASSSRVPVPSPRTMSGLPRLDVPDVGKGGGLDAVAGVLSASLLITGNTVGSSMFVLPEAVGGLVALLRCVFARLARHTCSARFDHFLTTNTPFTYTALGSEVAGAGRQAPVDVPHERH